MFSPNHTTAFIYTQCRQVAKWVGDIFNKGLYDIHIELKHWPLLEWEAEPMWETSVILYV